MSTSTGPKQRVVWSMKSAKGFCFLFLVLVGCYAAMQLKETPLQAYREDVRTLALTPDGSKLATAADDGTVTVWDFQAGKSLVSLRAHKEAVISIAFTPRCD